MSFVSLLVCRDLHRRRARDDRPLGSVPSLGEGVHTIERSAVSDGEAVRRTRAGDGSYPVIGRALGNGHRDDRPLGAVPAGRERVVGETVLRRAVAADGHAELRATTRDTRELRLLGLRRLRRGDERPAGAVPPLHQRQDRQRIRPERPDGEATRCARARHFRQCSGGLRCLRGHERPRRAGRTRGDDRVGIAQLAEREAGRRGRAGQREHRREGRARRGDVGRDRPRGRNRPGRRRRGVRSQPTETHEGDGQHRDDADRRASTPLAPSPPHRSSDACATRPCGRHCLSMVARCRRTRKARAYASLDIVHVIVNYCG